MRATGARGDVVYIKALRPEALGALVDRHERLLAAGAPVPAVLRADHRRGLVVLAALHGPTLRDLLKSGAAHWPRAEDYEAVYAAFRAADLTGMPAVEGRLATAPLHAEMLARVLPAERPRLDRLAAVLRPERVGDRTARPPVAIHGDLYEAQLVTTPRDGATRITGLLDVDDAAPGDPLDDRASVIAHLLVRALDAPAPQRHRLEAHAAELRRRFGSVVDLRELDVVTAVVGLATGPFRVQHHDWARAVPRHLARAGELVRHAGEGTLRSASSSAHVAARQRTQPKRRKDPKS